MPYSVGLYFDNKTDTLVRNIWQVLHEKGLASYYHQSGNRPHISLGIFDDTNQSKANSFLQQMSRSLGPVPLSFQQIGIFPSPNGAVFWGPVVSKELLDFHMDFYWRFSEFSLQPEFDYYKPGHWIPHCGLAMDIKNHSLIPQIIESCISMPNPYPAKAIEIGLISFQPVKHLSSYRFTES